MKTLLVACLVVFGGIARADVPPPDDYVEDCTIEKQSAPGLTCDSCRAWHGERDACDKTLGVKGYRKMCQGWGASAWTEVWCSGEATKDAAEGPGPTSGSESKKTGCEGGATALLTLLALPFLRRRR